MPEGLHRGGGQEHTGIMATAGRAPSRISLHVPLLAALGYLFVVARLIGLALEEGVGVDGGFATDLASMATLPWSAVELRYWDTLPSGAWQLWLYGACGLVNALLIYGVGRLLYGVGRTVQRREARQPT
jgi:hypothetical protein